MSKMANGSGEIPVDPNNQGGNAVGVFIQELTVRLEDEPPVYPISVKFEGKSQ